MKGGWEGAGRGWCGRYRHPEHAPAGPPPRSSRLYTPPRVGLGASSHPGASVGGDARARWHHCAPPAAVTSGLPPPWWWLSQKSESGLAAQAGREKNFQLGGWSLSLLPGAWPRFLSEDGEPHSLRRAPDHGHQDRLSRSVSLLGGCDHLPAGHRQSPATGSEPEADGWGSRGRERTARYGVCPFDAMFGLNHPFNKRRMVAALESGLAVWDWMLWDGKLKLFQELVEPRSRMMG